MKYFVIDLNAGHSCCTAENEEEDYTTGCSKCQQERQTTTNKLTGDDTMDGHTVMSTGSNKVLPQSGDDQDQLTTTEPARSITSCGN